MHVFFFSFIRDTYISTEIYDFIFYFSLHHAYLAVGTFGIPVAARYVVGNMERCCTTT